MLSQSYKIVKIVSYLEASQERFPEPLAPLGEDRAVEIPCLRAALYDYVGEGRQIE